MITRRAGISGGIALALASSRPGSAAETPGVTDTEIKIGNTHPYSGPASAYGVGGRMDAAFFKMVNDQGGVAGRKINFISYDDGYSPPRTVEQTRRLVEQDGVALIFSPLGTPTNSAIFRYLNEKKVPHLFVASGADKWGDSKTHPWTIGFGPSYRTEAQIYAKYILRTKPNAKIAVFYQNDDFGKDYPDGLRDVLGKDWDKHVIATATYEVTDATIDSQLVTLQASGADVLFSAPTPKFAAMMIRKLRDLDWHPLTIMSNVSSSVGAVMRPAGPENGIGIISTAYLKDGSDPKWDNDPGMQQWRAFMTKYLPGGDVADINNVYAYAASTTMWQVLKQCDGDFSRENLMKQALNLHDLDLPVSLPGIKVNTSPTNYRPMRAMQLIKWNGSTWEHFGSVIEGSQA